MSQNVHVAILRWCNGLLTARLTSNAAAVDATPKSLSSIELYRAGHSDPPCYAPPYRSPAVPKRARGQRVQRYMPVANPIVCDIWVYTSLAMETGYHESRHSIDVHIIGSSAQLLSAIACLYQRQTSNGTRACNGDNGAVSQHPRARVAYK